MLGRKRVSRLFVLWSILGLAACGGESAGGGAGGSAGASSGQPGGGGSSAEPGSVGSSCLLSDEQHPSFSGYRVGEVNLDLRNSECDSELCLGNHFQGRVTCPEGQPAPTSTGTLGDERVCTVPGSEERLSVAVPAQLPERPAATTVHCSCRCAGPDPSAQYCSCPAGMECAELVGDYGNSGVVDMADLAGSYCIVAGMEYDPRG